MQPEIRHFSPNALFAAWPALVRSPLLRLEWSGTFTVARHARHVRAVVPPYCNLSGWVKHAESQPGSRDRQAREEHTALPMSSKPAAEASAAALGTICYICSGIALSFERFAPFWEPLQRPSALLGLPAHHEQHRAVWPLMHAAGWVTLDTHPFPNKQHSNTAEAAAQAAFSEARRGANQRRSERATATASTSTRRHETRHAGSRETAQHAVHSRLFARM